MQPWFNHKALSSLYGLAFEIALVLVYGFLLVFTFGGEKKELLQSHSCYLWKVYAVVISPNQVEVNITS